MVRPSADTEGEWFPPDAVVNWRLSLPSVDMMAICVVVPVVEV
jgi:hypothetical protein